jgi:hypothetical protein
MSLGFVHMTVHNISLDFTIIMVHKFPMGFIQYAVHISFLGFIKKLVNKSSLGFIFKTVHNSTLGFVICLVRNHFQDFIRNSTHIIFVPCYCLHNDIHSDVVTSIQRLCLSVNIRSLCNIGDSLHLFWFTIFHWVS